MKIVNPTAILGEDLACTYLIKKGYHVIERNFRVRNGELDIIATYKNTLVFIEVKTRTSNTYGTPLEAITTWKLKILIHMAQFYKMLHPKLPDRMRIDAIAVDVSRPEKPVVEHIENISGF